MKINVEFESLEEMRVFAEKLNSPSSLDELVKGPCVARKLSTEETEMPETEPAPASAEETEPIKEPEKEPEPVKEEYTLVDVRGNCQNLQRQVRKPKCRN